MDEKRIILSLKETWIQILKQMGTADFRKRQTAGNCAFIQGLFSATDEYTFTTWESIYRKYQPVKQRDFWHYKILLGCSFGKTSSVLPLLRSLCCCTSQRAPVSHRVPPLLRCLPLMNFLCGVRPFFPPGFLPKIKNMPVRLIGDSKLPVGVNTSVKRPFSQQTFFLPVILGKAQVLLKH